MSLAFWARSFGLGLCFGLSRLAFGASLAAFRAFVCFGFSGIPRTSLFFRSALSLSVTWPFVGLAQFFLWGLRYPYWSSSPWVGGMGRTGAVDLLGLLISVLNEVLT